MRLLALCLLICVSCVLTLSRSSRGQRSPARTIRSISSNVVPDDVIRQITRERKERRILRKKKQRLRELRAEIRALSLNIHSPSSALTSLSPPISKLRPVKTGDESKWRKRLLEKMKGILRRLDRMERKKEKKPLSPAPSQPPSTTPTIRTSIPTPTDANRKMKRIQSSIEQSRNGENGTACASHKDCRPGRCCQLFAPSAQCSFFSLHDNSACIDSCQCAPRLHCYRPIDNSTSSYCKTASSDDVRSGVYLHNKDAVLAEKRKGKKKLR